MGSDPNAISKAIVESLQRYQRANGHVPITDGPLMQSIWANDQVGDPVYQGFTFGGIHTGTPLVKADYPGLRAVRVGSTVTLVDDLIDSYTVPATTTVDGPQGTLGYAQVTANQSGLSAITDLTGLSVTVTVAASRRVKVTGKGNVSQAAATGTARGIIREGSTSLNDWLWADLVALDDLQALGEVVLTPSTGSHTYKLSLQTSAGTVSLVAAADRPAFILVEDIGPATPGSSTTTTAELWY